MDNRVEKVYLRLSEEIAGVDPVRDIDAAELCWIDPTHIDANTLGITPLSEFWVAGFRNYTEPDKWFPAQEGLETVNALQRHYQRIVADGEDPLGRSIEDISKKVETLKPLQSILLEADSRGIYFCLVATE